MGNSSIRIRHSYSGSGWSVRTIGPEKTEPKKEFADCDRFSVPIWMLVGLTRPVAKFEESSSKT